MLAEDPDYAPAHSLLAGIYAYQSNNAERDFDEGFELSRQTALKALAIDPDSNPTIRLQNIIVQKRARHLLERADDLILDPQEQEQP